MRRPHRNHSLVVVLYLNAALLLAILVALLAGARTPSFLAEAYGAPPAPQPIAGGGGIYVMPAQFSPNQWGCYVMDVDAQTLCAYQWFTDKKLRLVAARSFKHDRQLHDFNTDNPTPAEVAKLIELENAGRRDRPQPQPEEAQEQPQAGDPAPEGKP
jgi:hypothetical protein